MAFFTLWALGIVLCALSIIVLFKQVAALKKSFDVQRNFMKMHNGSTKATFDQGWLFLDIVLAFFVLSFSTQSQNLTNTDSFPPEYLCFIGIAIFLASKAVQHWHDGRIVFGSQAMVYHDQEIPYSTIQSLEPYGSRLVELSCKKGKYMISKREAQEIESRLEKWRSNRRNKHH
ncbi:MAG: hypothetical protein Q4A59_02005 [Erysipelotrichaceae bacterium]|nr:hypothetical protein [Erysipelotrichaceae bacterium]